MNFAVRLDRLRQPKPRNLSTDDDRHARPKAIAGAESFPDARKAVVQFVDHVPHFLAGHVQDFLATGEITQEGGYPNAGHALTSSQESASSLDPATSATAACEHRPRGRWHWRWRLAAARSALRRRRGRRRDAPGSPPRP